MTPERRDRPVRIERLTESYRFDDELATLLTRFQYREDGIRLTAAEPRPLPTAVTEPATPALDAIVTSGASLVVVCYDERGHRMVNPIELSIIDALVRTIRPGAQGSQSTGSAPGPLAEGSSNPPTAEAYRSVAQQTQALSSDDSYVSPPSLGIVTPHNAQRGALETVLPDEVAANTVEKYQGGERDVIAISATVSDPDFARREERFILNPRRLLVAISRARLLTVVVCSTSLFEVVPDENERLDSGPVWARLFTQAVGHDVDPEWAGPLGEFTGQDLTDHATVPVRVYPSTINTTERDS